MALGSGAIFFWGGAGTALVLLFTPLAPLSVFAFAAAGACTVVAMSCGLIGHYWLHIRKKASLAKAARKEKAERPKAVELDLEAAKTEVSSLEKPPPSMQEPTTHTRLTPTAPPPSPTTSTQGKHGRQT